MDSARVLSAVLKRSYVNVVERVSEGELHQQVTKVIN